MVLVLVVDGSAGTEEEEDGSGFDPSWQLLTRKNFSTQIRQHEFALLMVTYPWSGESRALRNDLVQLMKYMHAQFQRLRLMLIYRNVEKLLGDVLVGDKEVNLVLYREAVPFKYSGKLSAQTILTSVWHAMSIPSGDLPFKQLNTLEDLEFFLQSTDKAVLLFDICGWVPKISAADNKNTRFSTTTKTNHANLNQEEGLERDGSVAKKSTVGSQLKPKSHNSIESVGVNVGGNKNTKTSPKSALMMTENRGFVSEEEICETSEGSSATLWKDGLHWASYCNDTIGTETNTTGVTNWQGSHHSSSHALFHGSSCTQEEYNYFKVLYTNLSRIARDNMLPPERQRFGLLCNRTVISALSTDVQHKSLLMLQFPDCPNCSKIFDRGNDLEEFVLTPHPLVTELQGEGYKLVPPLSNETASLILFIDRTSQSEKLRQRSKAALQEVRQVAFHYLLPYLSDKRKITGGDKSLPKTYSSRKARKKTLSPLSKPVQMQVLQSPELLKWFNSEENKVFQVKAAERGIQIIHRKIDGSLVSSPDQILNYFLQQENSGSQLNQDKLGQLAKKAGLQLLSGEFPLDTVQVSHIPETISSLIEKESGQTEEDFKDAVRKEGLETEDQHKKLGDIVDNIHTHSLTSEHIADNGNEKQDSGIVLNDMIFDPDGYDVKHEHSTTQECPARPWQEQCKNELSTNECLDNNSNQGCKTERIEDSGDQVTYLKESVNQGSVAEESVSQKLDVYDQKRILPESGNGEQNQDITIAYAEEKTLFEKKGEDFDKLDDQQDQNYGIGISFFYSEGGDQLRTILSSGASIPSVVLIDPVKQSHYLFPQDIPVTYSSLFDFINSFLNGTAKAYKLSEAFPPSPREPPRPPFVNQDFHEVDSIPRVTVGTFSRLVIGLEGCNETIETSFASSHHPGAAWGKDVLVLFSNDWCGFCKRSELVVREVHRFFEQCRNSMHVEGEIAPNSSARDMSSYSTEINREKSTIDVSKDEVTMGDHLKYEPTNRFPSIFQIDCTLNDCSSLLKSLNQKELYPALLLFPAGKKDDPIAYEGDISVNEVIEFLASYGSVSSHLYRIRGILWNKMQQGRGSLNTCTPWTLSSIPIQIEAPLHMRRTGHEPSLPISEQYGSNQFQEDSNRRLSLQKEIQKPTVGSVLVASEKLQGVYPFENSIIIIVKADFNEGFQGLIVNKPLSWDDLPKIYMQLEPLLRPTPIYLGGPIILKGMPFLSLTRIVDLEGFLEVLPGIYYGDPKVTGKIFMMIKVGKVQAHDFCFFLGFTNWGWQQLFDEVAEQAWHLNTYREGVVRWPAQK